MDAILVALVEISEPFRLLMLACGVVFGLIVGVIPGLSGLFGLSLLVPLTYGLDPYSALALLLGMASVTNTSDTIPAVLVGVPGTVGAIATVEDGHPMAKNGQAERALGAAYSASMIGGVFGALVLALAIPIMRPLVMQMRMPDFLAMSILGLFFVAFIAGREPLKGLAAALAGMMVSFVGLDAITASDRMTGGTIYLMDGLPVTAVFLGIFAIPELSNLLHRGTTAMTGRVGNIGHGLRTGIRDTLREWWLVLRCSGVGALIGAVPGVGVTVIDWVAYAVATRKPGDGTPYGEGNVRGVIAPESANNAKEGGALIPTIAIGLPGSLSMSILLAAFIVHGLTPGPAMLDKHLPVTISMVFLIAMANILGAGICLALSGQLARISFLPAHVILPMAIVFVTLGAFQARTDAGDFAVLLVFGLVGIFMTRHNWPRAAFSLGFVLGPMIERYFFLSYQITGMGWVMRPSILLMGAVLVWFAIRRVRALRGETRAVRQRAVRTGWSDPISFALFGLAALGYFLTLQSLPFEARMFPQIAAVLAMAISLALGLRWFVYWWAARHEPAVIRAPSQLAADAGVLGGCLGLVGLLYLFGHIPAMFGTVFLWGMIARRPLRRVLIEAVIITLIGVLIFDVLVSINWPKPWIGLL